MRKGYPRARMAGAHLSRFQGCGIEFDEVRPYQQGDDIRGMDWRVTARTGKPHTKLFREERERPAMLLLDMRPAMFFATRGALKAVVAAECASLLAWSILHQGDRVGSMLFDASAANTMAQARPIRGKQAVMRMLGNVIAHPYWQEPPAPAHSSLLTTLQRADHMTPAGSLIILVSDARGLDATSEAMLVRLLAHHNIVFVFVYDAFEREINDVGLLYATDGDNEWHIDSTKAQLRRQHAERFAQRSEVLQRLERRHGFVLIECVTDDDPVAALESRLGRVR